MKIYTKTGDEGETGLFGGARVSKADERVSAYGEVDELNSCIGILRTHVTDDDVDALLARIQSQLFDLGAELATVPGRDDAGQPRLDASDVLGLETAIDHHEVGLSPLKTFVLPGGSPAAAHAHLARTVCRRAERTLVSLRANSPVRDEAMHYVNRLSDLLFVLARALNNAVGVPDVPWLGRG